MANKKETKEVKTKPKKEVVKKDEVKEITKEEKKETTTTIESKTDENNLGKIISLIAVLVIIVVVVILSLNGTIVFDKEGRLNNAITSTGKNFYTEFYYDKISKGKSKKEVSSSLERFKTIGIKVNINSLKKYSYENNKRNIDILEKYGCDSNESKVIIYPKAPYGKKDFTIKSDIKCKSLK